MQESYANQQIELTKEKIAEGKKNADAIAQRLREISDYLDAFLGPVSEESIRDFEEKYGRGCQEKTAELKYSDK